MKIGNREVVFADTGKRVDTKEIAEILARHITGGDATGYCRRVKAEIEAKKAAARRQV